MFIKVTGISGIALFVRTATISMVYLDDEHTAKHTRIELEAGYSTVCTETPEEVMALIDQAKCSRLR